MNFGLNRNKIYIAFAFLIVTTTSHCYADDKHPLLIKGIGLGKVKAPCIPSPVKFLSNYDGHIEKILLKCSLNKEHDSTEITFSSDGKRVVRVLREQYLADTDPDPTDVMKAAINFYGTPTDFKGNSFAIYGDAHSCNGCVTDIKTNDYGKGLVICISNGWDFGRRYFRSDSNSVVYELIDMPEFLKANSDGEKSAQKHNQKMLSKQKF